MLLRPGGRHQRCRPAIRSAGDPRARPAAGAEIWRLQGLPLEHPVAHHAWKSASVKGKKEFRLLVQSTKVLQMEIFKTVGELLMEI